MGITVFMCGNTEPGLGLGLLLGDFCDQGPAGTTGSVLLHPQPGFGPQGFDQLSSECLLRMEISQLPLFPLSCQL